MTALLIDLDGVLYETEKPVAGAAAAVRWLRDNSIPHLFLTNTTSRPRRALVGKLAGFDIDVDEESILTPPVAASRWLSENTSGPAALFVPPATVPEFRSIEIAADTASDVAAIVIGDYGDRWTFAELNRAFRLLMKEPQPPLIALGMTRYWKAEDGLRLDTAPFVMALSHASGAEPVVLGKPAQPFFDAALALLDAAPGETLMIGDDIRGDVGGAQAAGIHAALVRTGKFRPADLEGDIRPDLVLDSFASLPDRWEEIARVIREN